MASFSPMDPREVVIGRGRANAIARAPYVDAIGAWDAGPLYSAHDRVMASIPEPCPWCDELVLDEHASEMRADSVYHLGCVYEHELDQEGSHDD